MKTRLIKTLVFTGISLIVIGGIASILTYPNAQKISTINLKKDIPINTTKNVTISGDSLNIDVLESTDKDIHVEVNGKSLAADKFEIKTTENDNDLKIELKEPTNTKKRQNLQIFFDLDTKHATVYLPKNIKNTEINTKFGNVSNDSFNGESLTIKSNAGNINLTNLKTKKLSIANNFGNISLTNSLSDTTKVKTNAGEVDVSLLIGRKTTIETSAGDVSLNQVTGAITAKTNAGGINLTNDKIDQTIDFQTNFGDISIKTTNVPKNSLIKGSLDLGDLTIFGKNTSEAQFGEGKNQIKLKTNAGDIEVERKNDSDDSDHMENMDMDNPDHMDDMNHMMDED